MDYVTSTQQMLAILIIIASILSSMELWSRDQNNKNVLRLQNRFSMCVVFFVPWVSFSND